MSTSKASVDGIAKRGSRYTYTLCAAAPLTSLTPGAAIDIDGVVVNVSEVDAPYISFEIDLAELTQGPLALLEVGSEVTMSFG